MEGRLKIKKKANIFAACARCEWGGITVWKYYKQTLLIY